MIRCPSCGNANRPDRRYCAECGGRLGASCGSCGAPNEPGEKFCGHCGASLLGIGTGSPPVEGARTVPGPAETRGTPEGERRQLTVLFCDLVGSTELAAHLDPEEWREVVQAYQQSAAEVVGRFRGHVAQYLGDGLLAYFGWPQAYGDDAERAVRAGLATIDAVTVLNERLEAEHGIRLAVRVGMHTGLVVVSQDGTVFGDTPNVAARVQTLAEPNTVLITAATHRLVAGLFVVEEGSSHQVKGIPEAVVVYRVVQRSGVRRRFAAAAGRGLTPFVGRERERRALEEYWQQARHGEGQMVFVVGEAGIGKSRLVEQLKEDLAGERHTWIECVGSPYHQNTPFFPVVDMLQQGLAWRGDESSNERLAGLERALDLAGLKPRDAVPLVAPILSLPVPKRYPPLLLSPEQQRRKVLATLAAWLFGLARVQPVVLVVEDVHWVDPSTLELLGLFVEQGATAAVLLMYTARPEFRLPWPLRAHHAQLTLSRLNKRQAREMVGRVAPGAALRDDIVEAVVTRTDGVPLFVEELTKAVVEAEPGEAAAWEIPATLQDSLMARLDRLGGAKEVAQVGAVIGRGFSYALLHAVSPFPEAELQAALVRLADAELLYPRGLPPEATYVFKHALVQDTAYASLLKSRRRELHRAIARVLAERFRDTAETQPEVLAVHYTEAGEGEPAVAAWQRAAEHAIARSAFVEAAGYYSKGLEVLGTMPDTPARAQQELLLQVALGHVLLATKGYGSPEAAQAFARARALGEQLGDTAQLLHVLLGLFASSFGRRELQAVQVLSDEILRLAESNGGPAALVWGHLTAGMTRYFRGELVAAREHLTGAIASYDEEHHPLPGDPGVMALSIAACVEWLLGFGDAARQRGRASLALARRLKKPVDLAYAQLFAGLLHVLLREPDRAREMAESLVQLSTEQQFPWYLATGAMQRGWALAEQGRLEEGIAQLREGLIGYTATMPEADPFYLGLLAEAQAQAGAPAEALATVEDALATTPEEVWKPDLLRVRGDLLARQGAEASAVEASYREAMDLARRHGAKAFELRAATSFGRWLQAQGRAVEARDLLAPIYGWFTEGFDTRDLREAKALLEELG